MNRLKFLLKYKTIKANNNMCNECELTGTDCHNYIGIYHTGCHKKNFKKRDWNKITINLIGITIIAFMIVYLILGFYLNR